MNDKHNNKTSRTVSREEPGTERSITRRRAYQRPELATYDSKAIMQAVGPAHGIYGAITGTPPGGSL
jgi:hypothetical protein